MGVENTHVPTALLWEGRTRPPHPASHHTMGGFVYLFILLFMFMCLYVFARTELVVVVKEVVAQSLVVAVE